jgi:ParB family chromosome partitioning protein
LVETAMVRPDPAQPRRHFDETKLAELTASVTERGIRSPIRVRYLAVEGVFQIIAGERRYRAAVAAGLKQVPCLIEDALASQDEPLRKDVLVEQIVENWQRADLEPVELSNALRELRDEHGMSQEEIARATGKSPGEVSKLLVVQKVKPDILAEAAEDKSGRFNRRVLVALARLPEDRQEEMAERVRSGELRTVDVEKASQRIRAVKGGAARGAPTTMRRYVVGSTSVQISFRKREVDDTEVLDVLDRVREMVRERQAN